MKKAIERIAIVLYYIGLVALPIYNVFIKEQVQIDGFVSLCGLLFSFLLYLVGWWFIWTPISLVIASCFFLKGDDAKDMRYGCGYPSLAVISFIICIVLYNKCNEDTNNNNEHIKEQMYDSTKKLIKNNKDIDGRVYICTGPQSKRYHRSSYCRGLNNCSGNIKAVNIETAEAYNRTPCRICY